MFLNSSIVTIISCFYQTTFISMECPSSLNAEILPLCAATTAFATDNPIPEPPFSEFRASSNL